MKGVTMFVRYIAILSVVACSLWPATAQTPPKTQPLIAPRPTKEVALTGTCLFSGSKGTLTATLTPKTDGSYDVVYQVSWKGGKASTWTGTIKSDLKGDITGDGSERSGGAVFDYAGKFVNGVADCKYSERGKQGGGRKGTLTLTLKK
jgi:hypothetical protein